MATKTKILPTRDAICAFKLIIKMMPNDAVDYGYNV